MSPIERSAGGGGGGGGTGTELDYVQITANASVTGTTDATASVVVTGNAVTYSGSQRVQVQFCCPGFQVAAGTEIVMVLYDGATVLGRCMTANNPGGSTFDVNGGTVGIFLTPSAGSHTFSWRAWRTPANAATVYAGAGTSGVPMPSWLRITTA